MTTLADILPPMVAALSALTINGGPPASVFDHLPESPPIVAADLPAIYLMPRAPTAALAAADTWQVTWPIDVLVAVQFRGGNLGADLAAVRPVPELVISALHGLRTMNGLLQRGITFADPAASDDGGEPFGFFEWKERTYVATVVHSICTIKRSGGL